MDDRVKPWVRSAAAVLLLVVAALALSWIAVPRPQAYFSHLSMAYVLANTLPMLVVFALIFCLTLRPLSSALLTIFAATLVVLGSNFKFSVVSQPLVISDFVMADQVVGNADLFNTYFVEQWYLGVLLLVLLAPPVLVLFLEKPLNKRRPLRAGLALFALVAAISIPGWAFKQGSPGQQIYAALDLPSYGRNPIANVKAGGLLGSLVGSANEFYFEMPRRTTGNDSKRQELVRAAIAQPAASGQPYPDLIVVQSEAFFDFRLIDTRFPNDFYESWDRLKRNAIHGFIRVDTYGGATLRTEFSALTGIPLELFSGGVDYPYFSVVTYPFHSLPRYLRSLGYETIAIHPYTASFWNRDLVYPRLGFDQFISVASFQEAARDGPYVSDAAVCKKILDVLQELSRPAFVFVVTMENHGPWSFERGSPDTSRKFDYINDPAAMLALNRYLYHQQNGMRMAQCLIEALKQRRRPAALLFFGDHAPAIPIVYRELGLSNPWGSQAIMTVPFLAWRSWRHAPERRDFHISYLPSFLLGISGLKMDDFFAANAYMRKRCKMGLKGCNVDEETKSAYAGLVSDRFAPAEATPKAAGKATVSRNHVLQ